MVFSGLCFFKSRVKKNLWNSVNVNVKTMYLVLFASHCSSSKQSNQFFQNLDVFVRACFHCPCMICSKCLHLTAGIFWLIIHFAVAIAFCWVLWLDIDQAPTSCHWHAPLWLFGIQYIKILYLLLHSVLCEQKINLPLSQT